MTVRISLLQILADGRFHSGEALGQRLNVTRAAIWKQLKGFEELGLTVHAVRGRGYRLATPIELLSKESLHAELSTAITPRITRLDILSEVDSTNTYIKRLAAQHVESGTVCLAEWQTAGRGRQGREWLSPFGCNIYLSLLWRFATGPAALSGLSLAVGVALARAVRLFAGAGVGLKWPNDVQWRNRKLAGILVELAGEASGPSQAIIGVGVNVRMPERMGQQLDQPWIDLYRISGRMPSRNRVAAAALEHLIYALTAFERQGLEPFLEEWRALDVMAGKSVQLQTPTAVIDGQAQGIDENGAFVIQVEGELKRFASGEVSVRMTT